MPEHWVGENSTETSTWEVGLFVYGDACSFQRTGIEIDTHKIMFLFIPIPGVFKIGYMPLSYLYVYIFM